MKYVFLVLGLCLFACTHSVSSDQQNNSEARNEKSAILKVGAENVSSYLPVLEGKSVAVVTNHTGVLRLFNEKDSIVGKQHLVDFLLEKGIRVKAIFAPEHGFRGKEDAGAIIKNGKDLQTGIPIYSLHGKYKKPQASQLAGVDVILFDIQDVGVRFYTYISTLHYVMEAAAENAIPLIVLDRPNPNGHFVDGPMMEEKHTSFLGMHPVPVVYGLTIGEYALMIEGEGWLPNGLFCELSVVKLEGWSHDSVYSLPIKPSPNLPNDKAVTLYPSLCFFEQTTVSVGRGTKAPFQLYGSPYLDSLQFEYVFVPESSEGARNPKHKELRCHGENLEQYPKRLKRVELQWLIKAYLNSSKKELFFKKNLEKLTGTIQLREQIENGWTEEEVRESWREDIVKFKNIRKKYLLYPDFKE